MTRFSTLFSLLVFAALAAAEEKTDLENSGIVLLPDGKGNFSVLTRTGETIHSAYPGILLEVAREAYLKGQAVTYDTVIKPEGFWGLTLKKKIFATKWVYSAPKIKAPERSFLEEKSSSNTSGLVFFCLALWVTAAFLLRFYLRSPAFSNFIMITPLLFAIFSLMFALITIFTLNPDKNNLAANIAISALGIIGTGITLYFLRKDRDLYFAGLYYGSLFWMVSLFVIFFPFCPRVVYGGISGSGLAIFTLAVVIRLVFPPEFKRKARIIIKSF